MEMEEIKFIEIINIPFNFNQIQAKLTNSFLKSSKQTRED